MKKFFIIPLAIALTSCSDLLGSLLNGDTSTDPTDEKVQEILESNHWGTAGFVIPKEYQEMNDFHVVLAEGEDLNESAVTDVIFEGNSVTLVFPGGGWRTTTFTYDEKSGLMKFDKPLIYGTRNFGGEDIYECHFLQDQILGADHIAFFDASVDDWQKVDINKGEWRMTMAPMDERQNEKLYEIDCIYGTSYKPLDLGIEGGASWAYKNVDNDKLFPLMKLNLGEIYYGLEYTMPTVGQAQKLIDNCFCLATKSSDGEGYVILGNKNGSFEMPMPSAPGEQMGFWLVGGSAFVYSYGDRVTTDGDYLCDMAILPVEETVGKMFCVRPVLK